ncbi:hypothetical protein [Metapseudomonas otitidis]|uniref:hypothetical protein n=1 Tax=Metapseudomonas otitidis TaxID=319939 RepID=UPI001AAFD536|nr:hypothetical protein [Pseudomonas otitidis]MBO2925964.1 hypothetical protein [Pseudomonas otitidis]
MSFNPLISLARNAKRQRMEMQCDPQWVLDLAAERDQLRAKLEAIMGQEPFWYAVISERAPVIDKAIRREDVAMEYAEKASATYYGVEVVPLYRLPPQQPDAVSVPGVHEFAVEILRGALEGGNFDGGDIQEMGVRYGLLFPEHRTERCGEYCECAEYGFPVECFRIARALLSTKNAEEGE